MHLHDESNIPRCVVLDCSGTDAISIYSQKTQYRVPSRMAFSELLQRSVDRHWQFFFLLGKLDAAGVHEVAQISGLEHLLKMKVF